MYNKNMTIAELRDEITNQIQARFENPIRSSVVYAGDKDTTPLTDPYRVKSRVIQPILNDVLDGVPFIVDLQTADRDQIQFQMRKFDNEGMPFTPMSGIIPSLVFKVRRKKHSSGRIIPYAVDVCDFVGDALPAEVVEKPVREYIIALANEAFSCHLSGNLEKMCRYMNAVLYFRAHGITDVDELGSMMCDISRNHSAWVSSTGLILSAPKEFDGDKKYEWMPKTREVPFVMADEVFARTIDTLESSGRMELLQPSVVQKLREMRPKLAAPFQKSAYFVLHKVGSGFMPENWLPAMVGYSCSKENMEDLYMKAVFLQTPHTRMFNIGFTEKFAASDDEVKAISNPGRWYAYNYATGVITSGEFTSSADIPALDNNMIYLVEGERVGPIVFG